MPEPQDPDENQDDGSVGNKNIQQQREHIKSLEKQLKEAQTAQNERDQLKVELATFQRSAAFDRLSIPPTGAGKLFRKSYDGELTDEAIMAEATEYGIVQAPQSNAPTIPGIDQDAMARMQQSLPSSVPSQVPNAMQSINGAANEQDLMAKLKELGIVDPTHG